VTEAPRVFIDTCLLVNLAIGAATSDEQDKLPASRGVIEAILNKKMCGYMSVITIAELLGNGEIRGNHISRQERHRRIKTAQAWLQNSPIISVEADSTLAFEAGKLAQQHQLKGPDALILASSLRIQAKTLYTWDNGLLKINGNINDIDIVKPSTYQYTEQGAFSFDDLHHT
jgi:hypothetical protein